MRDRATDSISRVSTLRSAAGPPGGPGRRIRRRTGFVVHWLPVCLLLWWPGGPTVAHAQGGTTATGASQVMNPALSLNGIFVSEWEDERRLGEQRASLALQEIELAAMSVVDPFFKANVNMSFGPGHEHGDEHEGEHEDEAESAHAHGDQVEVEEAFVRALSLPVGWGLRAGKILVPFGRLNQTHLHHLPFINAQLGFEELIGPHGVADVGAELAYAPDTPWYLNLCFFVGDGGADLFDTEDEDLAFAGRFENLWDLGEAMTLELAASALTGPAAESARRTFYGADLRFKWRDQRKTYGGAFEWMTELLIDSPEEGEERQALASYARYRFSRSWWLGTGYSLFEEGPGSGEAHEFKAQLALVPSEFSAVRLDASYLDTPRYGHILRIQLQLNFTIGSHPAHLY